MRIFISGICGFVGSRLALALRDMAKTAANELEICGIDNFAREGSWRNLEPLRKRGIKVSHGDVRSPQDLERYGSCDWLIDAAANPSVLAGMTADSSSRKLVDVNLIGTLNQLEYCKQSGAGLILLSSSRVYSIAPLATLPLKVADDAFQLDTPSNATPDGGCTNNGDTPVYPGEHPPHGHDGDTPVYRGGRIPHGVTSQGVSEVFSTQPPISLYGVTKLAAEYLALEYHHAFGIPVWVNRCGVLAGATQFGKADQGIFSFWLENWFRSRQLRYIGFGGHGYQVRDVLHPRDLAKLVWKQLGESPTEASHQRLVNVSGGCSSALSLRQLSKWCEQRWGLREILADPEPRRFDLPWVVLDCSLANALWGWQPEITTDEILDEIADYVEQQDWSASDH